MRERRVGESEKEKKEERGLYEKHRLVILPIATFQVILTICTLLSETF